MVDNFNAERVHENQCLGVILDQKNVLETSDQLCKNKAGKECCRSGENKTHTGPQITSNPVFFTCIAMSELLCRSLG